MNEADVNSRAWDGEVDNNSYWAKIADDKAISDARDGKPGIRVTINKDVPLSWIEGLKGKHVLVLGGGGGQQTPVLSAFGCDTECCDISRRMLEKDREALEKYNLKAKLHQMDMKDLSLFPSESFDAVISPVSLNFIRDIKKVYKEVSRVLKSGGSYIFGIANPALYIFDDRLLLKGKMKIKYTLPFADEISLSKKEFEKRIRKGDTIEFSHTLETIIGGLNDAGFVIAGFISDGSSFEPIDSFLHDCYLAFRAIRI